MFVPVKTISQKDYESLKDKLDSIAGVSVQSTSGRVYPYAEICAHLTGYVQTATAEDLETYADKGYTQDTLIGKSGLEGAYEDNYMHRMVWQPLSTMPMARKKTPLPRKRQ